MGERGVDPLSAPSPAATSPDAPGVVEPPVLPPSVDAQDFGVLHIPRFGREYMPKIAGGTTRERTLDTGRVGHYTGHAMPGEVGNFPLAAHSTTFGKPFNRIADLKLNDAIVIETQEGWFTYRFRTLAYVSPDAVDVLLDVPQAADVSSGERYITLTSCSPMFSLAEMIIAYGLFEGFTPRADGPPASLNEVSA